ncbi:MAG: hypothetical protein E7K14_01625 [Bacillota bacterium]|nr:hypothetical protein [Bacillota bacterium]
MIKTVSPDGFLDIAEKELYHQNNFVFKFENPDPELRQTVLKKLFKLLPDDILLSFDPNNFLGNVYDDYRLKYVNWLRDIDSYILDTNVDLVYVMNTDSYRYSLTVRSLCDRDTDFGVLYNISNYRFREPKTMEEKNMKMNMKSMMEKLMPEELHNEVAFAMNGNLAVRAADGNYYYYDGHQLINSYDMVIPADDMAMLVPTQTLAVGDIVKYNDSFYYITKYNRTEITGINLSSGMVDDIKLTVDVLGISAFRKVVSIMSMMGGTDPISSGNANPMNMMFMMSLFDDDKKSNSDNPMMKMMKIQMMSQMFNNGGMSNNPFFSMFGQPVGVPNEEAPIYPKENGSENHSEMDDGMTSDEE